MQFRPLLSRLGSGLRNRPRPFAAIALALAAPALGGAAPATVSVEVTITDLRNDKGVVRACMTDDPKRFPRCRNDEAAHRMVVRAGETLHLRFDNVRPGTYAIALLHDENENGRADRALTMIPKEGYGFSRDAPVRMGPPGFAAAAFSVGSTPVRHTIRMRYML